jgi:hypothetical protein
MVFDELRLKKGQKGFAVGQTGTGKTFLCEHLLPADGLLGVIDGKRECNAFNCRVFDDPRKLIRAKPDRFIYRPKPQWFASHGGYDAVYKYCYERGNMFVFTDEVLAVCKGRTVPHWLNVCVQMGRSKGITMLSGTQRPSWIPINLITEARKLYAFRLSYPDDVKKMEYLIPGYDKSNLPERYFYYRDVSTMEHGVRRTLV